jgi:hypothetical protein
MKISTSTIFLFTLLVLTLVSISEVYAQESGSPSFESYDSETTIGSEKVVSNPREGIDAGKPTRSSGHPVLQLDNNDSVVVRFQTKTPAQQKAQNKSKEDDDSILSFNFLYYLIERYKLQDIIE